MTQKPVNLNKARKARARAAAKARADTNAAAFGRSKAQKTLEKSRQDSAVSRLDQHRREPR